MSVKKIIHNVGFYHHFSQHLHMLTKTSWQYTWACWVTAHKIEAFTLIWSTGANIQSDQSMDYLKDISSTIVCHWGEQWMLWLAVHRVTNANVNIACSLYFFPGVAPQISHMTGSVFSCLIQGGVRRKFLLLVRFARKFYCIFQNLNLFLSRLDSPSVSDVECTSVIRRMELIRKRQKEMVNEEMQVIIEQRDAALAKVKLIFKSLKQMRRVFDDNWRIIIAPLWKSGCYTGFALSFRHSVIL